jgi:hypothetical protein
MAYAMERLTINKYYLLAFIFFFGLNCFAQETETETETETTTGTEAETEYGLWSSVDLQKKWDNGIAIAFEQESRLRDNFTTTDKFMSTLDFSYKPLSFLKGGVSYTMINYNHPGKESTDYEAYWEMRRRYSLYLQGQYEFHRFSISLKERYQNTYRVGVKETSTRANPKELLRSKLTLAYNVRGIRLEPYTYCEWQHSLNAPAGNNGLVEVRYAAGLEYKFKDGISIDCGYLYDIDKEDLVNTHVLTFGIGYSF